MTRVLVDTGPLVAVLARDDQYHALCVELLRTLQPPLVTCWPVITEAAYLLRRSPEGIASLLRMLERELLMLAPLDASAVPWFNGFFQQYRDLNPQLADAALLYLAEQLHIDTVFTLDHRHFRAFRRADGRPLHVLPETL